MSQCLSACMSQCLSVCISQCLHFSVSVCPSCVHPSVCLSLKWYVVPVRPPIAYRVIVIMLLSKSCDTLSLLGRGLQSPVCSFKISCNDEAASNASWLSSSNQTSNTVTSKTHTSIGDQPSGTSGSGVCLGELSSTTPFNKQNKALSKQKLQRQPLTSETPGVADCLNNVILTVQM